MVFTPPSVPPSSGDRNPQGEKIHISFLLIPLLSPLGGSAKGEKSILVPPQSPEGED